MDIWKLNNRTYWKDDKKFLEYTKYIEKNMMTFEEIVEFSLINTYIKFKKDIIKDMKKEWQKLIKEWNSLRDIDLEDKTYIYSGLCYLFVVIKYDEIIDLSVFSVHDIESINVCHYFSYKKNLPYEGAKDLSKDGPSKMLITLYNKWLYDKLDRACWLMCYKHYERKNNLLTIFSSSPTKKIF